MTNGSGLQYDPEAALAYLRKVDPKLAAVIDRVPFALELRAGEPYHALLRTILYQQLAGPAAAAIQRRLYALHEPEGEPPTPQQILDTTDEQFRAAGVSRQKAGYMRDLALHMVDGRLDFDLLPSLDDDEVIKRIT